MDHSEYVSLAARARLSANEIERFWKPAAEIDNSLKLKPGTLAKLAGKRVEPARFSRSRLFQGMLDCEPRLFSNLPIGPRWDGKKDRPPGVAEQIRSGFPRSKRARVRTEDAVSYLSVPRVVDKWARARSVFGVTDLHYVGTRFNQRMDTDSLNDFNLLPRGSDGFQSQDSLVVSSEGAYTDSHSDDHSGSNHSFTGVKLWLLWDTLEGFSRGIEDVERCDVYGRAAFDLGEFARMRSSRWILIGPGQTMFIPAHLTHKVITLQRYLGLGSFHAGLPGFVDLLERWSRLPPLWATRSAAQDKRCNVEFITRRAIRKMRQLAGADPGERFKWGVPYLRARLKRLDAANRGRGREPNGDSNFDDFVRAARRL